ncbi:MAG: methyltransferase [Planctomycetota bacterium]|jgi:protein-S-isoprenylcysteine O-methyltransferase Ste14
MMHTETVFKIAFGGFAVLFLTPVGRANHQAKLEHSSRFAQAANEYPPLPWVRGLVGIPLWAFLIDWLLSAHWFPWASVSLPVWAHWCGVGLAGVVAGLMWWTMHALGSNYRGTMGLHPNHRLVTQGPYRFVRHPMNTVSPLISIVLFLMSANWVVGAGALILIGTISIVRAPVEERQLIERFGEEYRAYMRRTGRFLPHLRRRGDVK